MMELKKEKSSLTKIQQEYVNFVEKFWLKKGCGPTEQEIANHFLVTAVSAHTMIAKLCSIGVLIKTPGVARSVRLLGHSGIATKLPPGARTWVYVGK